MADRGTGSARRRGAQTALVLAPREVGDPDGPVRSRAPLCSSRCTASVVRSPTGTEAGQGRDAAGTEFYTMSEVDELPAARVRPLSLGEPPGPAVKVGRVQQPGAFELPSLDVPVLQMEDQLVDVGGQRPGVLQDPAPQLVSEHAGCPCSCLPSLATPSLADATADVVDSASVRFLAASALAARRKDEAEELARSMEEKVHLLAVPRALRTPEQLRRIDELCAESLARSGEEEEEEEEEKETS